VSESFGVVVVGGGLAGLTTARALRAAGRSVAVLEASDRVGGRTRSHAFADGTVADAGGGWVGATHTRMQALAEALGVGLFPSYCAGDDLLSIDGAISRAGFDDRTLADVAQTQRALEALAETVPLEAPWDAPDARAMDDRTLDAWLGERCQTGEGLRYWRMLVPGLLCADAAQISLLYFLFYVRSGEGIDMLVATEGGAQERRVRGGSHTLSRRMAEELGDAVRLNAPVHLIEQDADGVVVHHDGGRIAAGRAVVAVAPALAGRIRYRPALDWRRDQLTQQTPMGFVIKAQARYPAPFWRADGLTGFALSTDGPVTSTFDTSPADAGCGVLCAFVESDHALRLAALDADERRAAVVAGLARLFGAPAGEPDDYMEVNWAQEEWTRGCFVGHPAVGAWTRFGSTLRAPAGRIHWAGTETAERWSGYMEGAVRSGERAAAEVLAA
jgi:monoamine oxidase